MGILIFLFFIGLYLLVVQKFKIRKDNLLHFIIITGIYIIITGVFNSHAFDFYFIYILTVILLVYENEYYGGIIGFLMYLWGILFKNIPFSWGYITGDFIGIATFVIVKLLYSNNMLNMGIDIYYREENIFDTENKLDKQLIGDFRKHFNEQVKFLKNFDKEILFFMYSKVGDVLKLLDSNEPKLLKKSIRYSTILKLNKIVNSRMFFFDFNLSDGGRSLALFNNLLEIKGIIIKPVIINEKNKGIIGIATSNEQLFKRYKDFYELSLDRIILISNEIVNMKNLYREKEEFKFFYETLEELNKENSITNISKSLLKLFKQIMDVKNYNFIEYSNDFYKIIFSTSSRYLKNEWIDLSQSKFLQTIKIQNKISYIKIDKNKKIKMNISGSVENLPSTNYLITIPIHTKLDNHYVVIIELRKQFPISDNEKNMFEILKENLKHIIENRKLLEKFSTLANHDGLTGLLNHKKIQEELQELIKKYNGTPHTFGVLMLDIDHFKRFNDNYGHKTGDQVLKRVANIMKKTVKEGDLVGRYGGEEFLVILKDVNGEKAFEIAERIRKNVEKTRLDIKKEVLHITISIGISIFPEHSNQKDILIKKADKALYQAKENGRNQVVLSGGDNE